MANSENGQADQFAKSNEGSSDSAAIQSDVHSQDSTDYRSRIGRRGVITAVGVVAAALIVGLILWVSRDPSPTTFTRQSGMSIPEYFAENGITATPVGPGEPGTPVINFALPTGWSDAGPDTPKGAYGAAFYDKSVDADYPPSVVVLLSKLSGDADPAKILEFAPGELEELPGFTSVSEPKSSTMSGFDAVQYAGIYDRDDVSERAVAQKTVVIPAQGGLYVLQMNVDAPKSEAAVLQAATASLDERAKIAP